MNHASTPALVVFVYFRASPADSERIARQLATMQDAIGRRLGGGSLARFGHRQQEAPEQRTWLESYELPRDTDVAGFLALRADCAASAGLGALVGDAVHMEVFEMGDSASCA